jgi:hypothetical protein
VIRTYAEHTSPEVLDQLQREAAAQAIRDIKRGSKPLLIAPSTTVGRRTLDDLPSGSPPSQLVPPFLSPEGVTILYGLGGEGKGYVSLWLALQLVRNRQRVTVIDFENHPGEWGRRSRAMGYTAGERRMVDYRAPFADEWTARRGPLGVVADLLREDLDEIGHPFNYLIVDSYTTAASGDDGMGGARAAQEFFNGITRLGRPALVIAHVAGGGDKFPDKPFGSVFVHNLARETWAVARVDENQDDSVPHLHLRRGRLDYGHWTAASRQPDAG